LNDGNLVRICFFCSWDGVDIGEQESMIISQVNITPGGLQSFGNRVGSAKEELEQINTVF
jgi:hypothetical protein